METTAHLHLKRCALHFLRQNGFVACACEVRCPIPRWTADVAGWTDRMVTSQGSNVWQRCEPRTVMIECKQSRTDFLRDNRRLETLLALRTRLDGIRRSIEEHRIKSLESHLRREGTSLFHELAEWDFAASRMPSYRRTLRQLERLDEHVHGGTKFARLARYAQADALYLAAPAGLLRASEVPPGWGLLECDNAPRRCRLDAAIGLMRVRIDARPLNSNEGKRQRLLRNIAAALTTRASPVAEPLPLFSLSNWK